jgi:voltage-gated potassium channel
VNDDNRARFGRAFALGPSLANVTAMAERRERWIRLARAGMVMVVILALGTWGYWYLSDGTHSLIEALYMTVISISTVGFNEIIPITTDAMRVFTMSLILMGGASVVYFLAAIAAFIIEGDVLYGFWQGRLRRRLGRVKGHIIVVGLGRVGFHTYAELAPSRVPVLGIDLEPERVEQLITRFGDDVLFAVGEAFDEAVLRAAGLERASAVIACLPDDRDNFLLGVTARAICPDIRLLIRLVDPANEAMFSDLAPIDVVHPPTIAGRRVANLLLRKPMLAFTDALIAADTHTRELVELPCPPRLVGRRIAEITHGDGDTGLVVRPSGARSDALIIGHRRAGEARLTFRPAPETPLGPGDTLLALGQRSALKSLEERLIAAAHMPRPAPKHTAIIGRPQTGELAMPETTEDWRGHVIIAGAGTVGRAIGKALRRLGARVCLIERDPAQLATCMSDDPGLRLVSGDVFDRQVLMDAGIADARAFITALQTLRDNLFLCAVVRHANPRAQILARVGTPTEAKRLRTTGATVFNPGEIGGVHLARRGLHPELVSFAEGLEATLERTEQLAYFTFGAAFSGKTLGTLALEARTGGIILGARLRADRPLTYHPPAETRLEAGATLLVLGESDELNKMKQLVEADGASH